MIKALMLEFCNVKIYDNYMVVVMNEGVHITPKHNIILVEIVETYYKNKPFVYITHRKNAYSVDPAVYFETSKIKNLVGFAIVAEIAVSKGNALIEKLFSEQPFEIFYDMNDAKKWAEHIIENKS